VKEKSFEKLQCFRLIIIISVCLSVLQKILNVNNPFSAKLQAVCSPPPPHPISLDPYLIRFIQVYQRRSFQYTKLLYGSRCTQLPLIEKLPQWLSGPSSSLSVAADRPTVTRPDSNDVRTRSIYSTIGIDDINAKAVEA
jgi:hypothetical protein